ncbi:MAG: hypothetical protein ABW277_24695 [Longimicrobiaceae bacterium]
MRALSTLALVALLSSCAALPAPPTAGLDPAQYDGRPLRARIVNGGGRLMVNTNRPAHVAIFEIYPGRGVGLLYPAYRGERNYLSGGLNSIFLTQSRSYYSYFQPAPFFASASRGGPRYLYMIASDAPLRLGSFLGAPGALRRSLGMSRYASGNPYGLMEDLAELVLPYGEAGDWSDDVYVVYPERSYGGDYEAMQWIRVQCPDGRNIQGPAYYVFGGCALQDDVPPLAQEPGQQNPDSGAVKPPSRRRPEPQEPGVDEGVRAAPAPTVVERIPEPEPARRPGVRLPERLPGSGSADTPWDRSGDSQRAERRSEAVTRDEPVQRQEPRAERPEPRSDPAPRVEAPRPEPPRVESSRPEPRSSEPPARR